MKHIPFDSSCPILQQLTTGPALSGQGDATAGKNGSRMQGGLITRRHARLAGFEAVPAAPPALRSTGSTSWHKYLNDCSTWRWGGVRRAAPQLHCWWELPPPPTSHPSQALTFTKSTNEAPLMGSAGEQQGVGVGWDGLQHCMAAVC